jgi:dTDP-4-dehydrorhamnose 3,5-epimerase
MGMQIYYRHPAPGDLPVKFVETDLQGAYVIEIEPHEDERGFFARTFCLDEFKRHGIDFSCAQCNISYNKEKGTLRGMHYQCAPHEEAKIVSCTRGSIYDVIIDIRPGSPTFKKWVAKELSLQNHSMVFIPKGFAHGFQTLTGDTEIQYMMSEYYHPECARGVKFDDTEIAIQWPDSGQRILGEQDRNLPCWNKMSSVSQ